VTVLFLDLQINVFPSMNNWNTSNCEYRWKFWTQRWSSHVESSTQKER